MNFINRHVGRSKIVKVVIIANDARNLVAFRGSLIGELHLAGHAVLVLAPNFNAKIEAAVSALGAEIASYPLSRTGLSPLDDFRTLLELRRLLRRNRAEVVLSCAVKPAIYGTIASRLSGVQRAYVMMEGLGYAFTGGGDQRRKAVVRSALKLLFRFALRRADTVMFLNPDDRADFVRMRLVRHAQTSEIGGIGVDLDAWQARAGVQPIPLFVFVGRLLRDKGIFEFVEGARLVKVARKDARFIVLGDIDANPTSVRREQIETWVSSGLIEWQGWGDVRPWLRQATAFVLPSYREGVPLSTQEAMAMSRAIITTDVPGCRETVKNGVNGYLVQVRDALAISNAMLKLCNDPERAAKMGEQSRIMAEALFDQKRAAHRVMKAMRLDSG